MMDAPELRIGWLKMFLRVLHGTGGGGTYAELIAFCERNVAEAERELAAGTGMDRARSGREPMEAGHVRERA